jgi:hypothetical protein
MAHICAVTLLSPKALPGTPEGTMKTRKLDQKTKAWDDARKRYHLSQVQVQMARELGMNPAKLGKIANHKQEPWKVPLPEFIEELYMKRFGRAAPGTNAVHKE